MKMITTLAPILMGLVLVSCGSSEKKEEPKPTPRTFQKDYTLMDASAGLTPEWIEEPTKGDSAKEVKNYRYFVSEGQNKNKRLCVRSAEARASARIAAEIAQFIKNTYGESTQGGGDEEVTEYMEESLAQEAQSFIVGAQVHKSYWEKRRYQQSLGAAQDEVKYTCFALMKMSKKALAKAIKNSTAKLYQNIQDPEVKTKTQKVLKDASDAFNNLEKPVQVEE